MNVNGNDLGYYRLQIQTEERPKNGSFRMRSAIVCIIRFGKNTSHVAVFQKFVDL